jgi:hypothetical protein
MYSVYSLRFACMQSLTKLYSVVYSYHINVELEVLPMYDILYSVSIHS